MNGLGMLEDDEIQYVPGNRGNILRSQDPLGLALTQREANDRLRDT